MNKNDFYCEKISMQSKMVDATMALIGLKAKMETKFVESKFEREAAGIPKSFSREFVIEELSQNARKIWTISPVERISDCIILFFHGGAYTANITTGHWRLIEQLLKKTKSSFVVPDYPLTPESDFRITYQFVDELFEKLKLDFPNKKILFMGDSAGAGLALGFAQLLRNENRTQPKQIILFSPWLDITMSNPELKNKEKSDNLLTINGLKAAAQRYAGNVEMTDFRLSPLSGEFEGLSEISVFTGTNDLLNVDARKLKNMLNEKRINFNYFEYADMFHDWVIIPSLKETKDVIDRVVKLISSNF